MKCKSRCHAGGTLRRHLQEDWRAPHGADVQVPVGRAQHHRRVMARRQVVARLEAAAPAGRLRPTPASTSLEVTHMPASLSMRVWLWAWQVSASVTPGPGWRGNLDVRAACN